MKKFLLLVLIVFCLTSSISFAESYYWADGYQASWDTTASTYNLSDLSVNDTSTFESGSPGLTTAITVFYDHSVGVSLTSHAFTYKYTGLALVSSSWILEGSNDTTSWTTISSSLTLLADNAFHLVSENPSGVYRYFRLSLRIISLGSFSMQISDWRISGLDICYRPHLGVIEIG